MSNNRRGAIAVRKGRVRGVRPHLVCLSGSSFRFYIVTEWVPPAYRPCGVPAARRSGAAHAPLASPGPICASSAARGPILTSRCGPSAANLVRLWAKFGPHFVNFWRIWQSSAQFGPHSTKVGRSRPNVSQACRKLVANCSVKIGQIRRTSGQIWSNSVNFGPNVAISCQMAISTEREPQSAKFGLGPKLGEFHRRCGPISGQIFVGSWFDGGHGPNWPRSIMDRIGPNFDKADRLWRRERRVSGLRPAHRRRVTSAEIDWNDLTSGTTPALRAAAKFR